MNLLYEASIFEWQRKWTVLDSVVHLPDLPENEAIYFFNCDPLQELALAKGSYLTKFMTLAQDRLYSVTNHCKGTKVQSPLPPYETSLKEYPSFRVPCELAEAIVATMSQFDSCLCPVLLSFATQ